MTLRKKLSLVLLFLIVLTSNSVSAEEVYCAYPIIFVHGFRANMYSWDSAKNYFKQYFVDVDGYYPKYPYKHFFGYMENFPVCNYGFQKNGPISRNGSIPHIARGVLKQSIDDAIDAAFPDGYKGEKKVNIVAHSMGGLVVRSLLIQYPEYQSKINKVIFIGTPHEGSPYASALWIIDKEAIEVLPPLIDDYSNAYSKIAGTLEFLVPQTANLPFHQASSELQERLNRDKVVIFAIDKAGIAADGYAVEQMRLPFNCSYHDEIESKIGFKSVKIPIYIDYHASTTFLGQGALLTPNDFLTIRGENPNPEDFLNWALDKLNQYREGVPFGFNFPSGYTINEAKSPGDGFVTQKSQCVLEGEVKKITALHTEETTNSDTFKYILEKFEDPPRIECIRVEPEYGPSPIIPPPVPTYNYVVVKLKDYLLADIEIVEMKVNGQTVDLSSFQDPITQTYKPYVKYPDKAFLKERTDMEASFPDRNPLVLQPGEFWVKINNPYIYNVFLKVKNPAGKETFKEIVRPHYLNSFKQASAQGNSQQGSFEDISALAYNNYISSQPNPIDENLMWPYCEVWPYAIGVEAYSYLSPYEVDGQIEYEYNASIWRFSGPCLAFRFDSPLDKIKPFKLRFTGRPHGETGFDILVYHDPSNNWPPSETGELVSSFSSLSLFQPIEIDVDPQDIGPNGYYTLRFKADLPEANYIPYPAIPTGHGLEGRFLREAEICHDGYITIEPEEGGSP